jgi:hypothetical protein
MPLDSKTINKNNWSGETTEIQFDESKGILVIPECDMTLEVVLKDYEDIELDGDKYIEIYEMDSRGNRSEHTAFIGHFFNKEKVYQFNEFGVVRENKCLWTAVSHMVFNLY